MSVVAGEAPRGRSTMRFTPRAAILTVIVTALLLYMVVPLRTYLAQRDRLAQLEHQTQILQQQNARLQTEVRELNDPAYLERIARECLGMVKPGEIGFIIVPKAGSAPPGC
jgi:cell division protein FtsL